MAYSPAPAKAIRSVDVPVPPTGGAGIGTSNARHRTDLADRVIPTNIVGLGRHTRDSTSPPTSKNTQENISSRTAACVDAPNHHESAHHWGRPAVALRSKRHNALLPRIVNENTDQRGQASSSATPADSSLQAEPTMPDRLLHRPSPNCHHRERLGNVSRTRETRHRDQRPTTSPSSDGANTNSTSGWCAVSHFPSLFMTTPEQPVETSERQTRVTQAERPQKETAGMHTGCTMIGADRC